ncbi:MAG: GHKL domain-containing protein [Lachnospiraceae bacterium]|nr:GHKL domain-containing protein [Lachnospiraceae bacterium]
MLFEDNTLYVVIKILLVVIGTLGMMASTTELKHKLRRIVSVFSLYLLYVAAFSAVFVVYFDYKFYLRFFPFTISAPAIYLSFLLIGSQPSKTVFNHATQILLSIYISVSITLINTKIHGSEMTDFLIRLAAYGIIILVECRFLRRPFLRIFSIIQQGWLVLALIPCSLIFLAAALVSYPVHFTENPTGVVFIYLLGAVAIIIYFSIFQYLSIQYRFQTTRQNMELLEFQVENLKEKMTQDAAAAEQSRIDRHDTRHSFQTIAYLLEKGNTSEALDYITRSISRFQAETSVSYCNDILLNATLSAYFGQAKKAGITLETHLSLPDALPVDSGEFSIVIANALENAIKACCTFPEEQRIIIFRCIYKPKLMLEISNPCDDDVVFSQDGIPLSKEKEHGIGTRSIMAFCKKHNAFCSFSAENGYFTLKVIL